MRKLTSGGLYHVALILVASSSFNWAFELVTNINIAQRIFQGVEVSPLLVGVAVCVSALIVVWHNWID